MEIWGMGKGEELEGERMEKRESVKEMKGG